MKERYDVILVSGEPYVDHPFSGAGIIKRVLEDKGYKVGVIETPDWKKDADFLALGKPRLFFGVSSGSIDSMLVNYTPLKKKRQENEFSKMSYAVPDRAVTVYCNMIRKLFKESKIAISGIESSLRRFAHYDYWQNRIRPSILLDTRADILVYGYGELQVIEVAKRLEKGESLNGIKGTCIVSKEVPENFENLPSFQEVLDSKKSFCRMQLMFGTGKNLAQKFDNRYVLQYEAMKYTTKDLDWIYSLNYSRKIPKNYPEFRGVEFSVLTHRGCFGSCNFCSVYLNSGKAVVSRSRHSILEEISEITKMPSFQGTVELSGASANMYGMDCSQETCCSSCIKCPALNKNHDAVINLLREARKIPRVRKVIIKSGIRYDLALNSPDYLREIIRYHLKDSLTIAPEHVSKDVLELMNKKNDRLKEFIQLFKKIGRDENKDVELNYYLMVGHPGCTIENSKELAKFTKNRIKNCFVQVFTPTPMTMSTCMYYTSLNPETMERVYVPYTYNEKKKQKNIVMGL